MDDGLVIGADAGGTSTRAAVAGLDGRVLGVGRADGANLREVGAEGVAARVSEAVDGAFAAAGVSRTGVAAVFLGVAGCATAEERQAVGCAVAGLGFMAGDERLGVDHDLRVAQAGAFVGGPGVVLIAGTGACCYGRAGDGREHRAGGWGGRIDDGGSAAWLGQRAIVAMCRAEDGRGEAVSFREAVLGRLGVGSVREAVGLLEGTAYRGKCAGLGPIVTEAARGGDTVALAIVLEGAGLLAEMVEAVGAVVWADGEARNEGVREVAAVGGVLEVDGVMRAALGEAMAGRGIGTRLVEPAVEPVFGAVVLALAMLGPVTVEQRDAVIRSGRF